MTVGLPVSRLVNVAVNLQPPAAQAPSINTLLIIGTSAVIDMTQRMREYDGLTGVAVDFGTNTPEYLSAALWFEQTPQPTSVQIGRWARFSSSGQLAGGPILGSAAVVSTWQTIANGAFSISFDGNVPISVNSLDFTLGNTGGVADYNAIAGVINGNGSFAAAGAIRWDSLYDRFVITSASSGASSAVSFATTAGVGVDVSSLLGLSSTSSGAYLAPGTAPESAVSAVVAFDNLFSDQWYALMVPDASDSDHLQIAAYIEGSPVRHYYGVTTTEGGAIVPNSTGHIAYTLAHQGYNRTAVQWSSTNRFAVASYLSRILTTNWLANNTTITLMYKQEPGITAETLNVVQAGSLSTVNANVFVTYNNNTAIIQRGTSVSGQFTDTVIGLDWFAGEVQTQVYNLLLLIPTKIPQTDAGNHLILTTIENVCIEAVVNGLIAPGQWNSQGFGTLNQGDFLKKGYYVFAPPIATQTQSARSARMSVPFQIAVKMAGAIHTVDCLVLVNT